MLFSFIIVFREAIEVGLILAIIMSYLKKLGRKEFTNYVYYGTVIGVLLSIILAASLPVIYSPETAMAISGPTSATAFFVAIFILAYMMRRYMDLGVAPLVMITVALTLMFAGLYGYSVTSAPEMLESGALFSAALILTYVIFWMAKVAYRLKEKITSKLDLSVTTGKVLGVLTLSTSAVLREGVEAALLLNASMMVSPIDTSIGALLGILAASALSYIYIHRSAKLNWRKFFLYTSLLLVIFSSGILKVGLQNMAELGVFPMLVEQVYDASAILPEESIIGGLLYVFIGYTEVSPLLPLLAQIVYLVLALRMVARVYRLEIPRTTRLKEIITPQHRRKPY
ncbi:MAG: FTR1 family protein [Nitrososphaerales archaeon]